MELGTIFGLDKYEEAYEYIQEKGYMIKEIEAKGKERQFQIVEDDFVLTNEDISRMRAVAYAERTDPLTLRKIRKQALNEWTDEEEQTYISQITNISKEIEKEFPYNSEEPNL